MRRSRKPFFPILIFFVITNALFISGKNLLQRWGIDQEILIIGNLVIFAITLGSFFLAQKGLHNSNPHAFVRSVYTSMMLKLFAFIIAAFIYIATAKEVNKPVLFTLMGLYLVYAFIEVSVLTKLLRQNKNA